MSAALGAEARSLLSQTADAAGCSQDAACDLTFRVAGMSCAACQAHVQRALVGVHGVEDANVDLLAHKAYLRASPALDLPALTAAVRRAGYDLLPWEAGSPGSQPIADHTSTPKAGSDAGGLSLGVRAAVALLAGAIAMLLSMPLMAVPGSGAAITHGDALSTPGSSDLLSRGLMHLAMPLTPAALLTASPSLLRWILFALALGIMLFAAPEIYRAAWRAARHRTTNMNTLVALGTLVAFAASTYTTVTLAAGRPGPNFHDVYFEAVVLILAFLLAGRWLEARARDRANSSLRLFARQETSEARWVGEGDPATLANLQSDPSALLHASETLLPLDAVAVGDLLRILPGDRVPLDGILVAGRSSVDESMLTGEPLPITRQPGDKLFSGTLNLDGPLLLRATALGADSMQAQMARLLERARATRAPLQRLADRASAVFVPAVLALAALTFIAWAVMDNTGAHHLGYGRALSLAVAVLVVACPCAMGLAVPAAVAVSLGTAARAGILVKGGEALERLAILGSIALDKTGTLTEGKPHIDHMERPRDSPFSDLQVLRWAFALEQVATHPLAAAIRGYAAEHGAGSHAFGMEDAQVVPGLGVRGVIEGHHCFIGRSDQHTAEAPAQRSLPATAMHLTVDGELAASFYATDTLRSTAAPAVAQLQQLGLRSIMITGDSPQAAQTIASLAGISEVHANQLPADKLTLVRELQAGGQRIGMVGDGLNDAAALAQADAGIAMAAGTDLAREAGHVLLLHPDLTLVPRAIRLARRTRRLMRQNLAWAMLYNVLGIPVAAGVLLPHFGIALSPALASAAMALSSVSVLLNSLRLARPIR